MEKSCDSFWQWGNARKKMAFGRINSIADGCCSMSKKTSSVGDGFCSMAKTTSSAPDGFFSMAQKAGCVAYGFSSETLKEEVLLNNRESMDAISIHRSHVMSLQMSLQTALEPEGVCKDLGLPEPSGMKVNVSNSQQGEVNSRMSPMSVIPGLNVSSSPGTSNIDFDTFSLHPNVDLSTQKEKQSRFRVWKSDKKPAIGEGIETNYKCCKRVTFLDNSLHCSILNSEAQEIQLQSGGMDDEMRNLRDVGGSEFTSSFMDRLHKIPNIGQSIQNENTESFAALSMLADVAAWVLENGVPANKEEDTDVLPANSEEDKAKASSGKWEIFRPTVSHKLVFRRARGSFRSLPLGLDAHAHKFLPPNSEHILTRELSSPPCRLKPQQNEVIYSALKGKSGMFAA
ncbi:hypothetical protein SUGI_0627580 [Cryptomeria japonica]|nr:hypothetical protein SUGI_0627580 [Cryptomeria japonica]